MKKFLKGVINTFLFLIITAIVLTGAGLIYLTVNEYSPEASQSVDIFGSPTTNVSPGDKIKVMTYNIGFGAMDNEQDYYLDGGKSAMPGTKESITENLDKMTKLCVDQKAHVNFFQSVDVDSKRSYSIDEASLFSNGIYGRASTFANDYLCTYVPVPVTGLVGRVDSGELTLTRFGIDQAELRPVTDGAAWPSSTWNRKPVLLIDRVKLGDSTKELVLINVHFSEYADDTTMYTQYKELCEFMQMEFAKGNYVIAGGCFNAVLPSVNKSKYPTDETDLFKPYEISTENLTGGWKYCTDDSVPTMRLMDEAYSAASKVYVVDGFITSPNTIVENTATVDTDFRFSSHNPVVTEVTLVK